MPKLVFKIENCIVVLGTPFLVVLTPKLMISAESNCHLRRFITGAKNLKIFNGFDLREEILSCF